MTGKNFSFLPENIKGTVSDNNNLPEEHVDADAGAYVVFVVERTDVRLVLRAATTETYNRAVYLGTIAELGTSVPLWRNLSRPL